VTATQRVQRNCVIDINQGLQPLCAPAGRQPAYAMSRSGVPPDDRYRSNRLYRHLRHFEHEIQIVKMFARPEVQD
jgi:hypothetical protein